MPEKKFYEEFELARPRILGALLEAASTALRNLPTVHIPALPRMGDFTEFSVAGEPCFGCKSGTFLRAYSQNRDRANEMVLQSAAIGPALMKLMRNYRKRGIWRGTAEQLLNTLEPYAHERALKRVDWPRTPKSLANAVRRLQPSLDKMGISVRWHREKTRMRERIIQMKWEDK